MFPSQSAVIPKLVFIILTSLIVRIICIENSFFKKCSLVWWHSSVSTTKHLYITPREINWFCFVGTSNCLGGRHHLIENCLWQLLYWAAWNRKQYKHTYKYIYIQWTIRLSIKFFKCIIDYLRFLYRRKEENHLHFENLFGFSFWIFKKYIRKRLILMRHKDLFWYFCSLDI